MERSPDSLYKLALENTTDSQALLMNLPCVANSLQHIKITLDLRELRRIHPVRHRERIMEEILANVDDVKFDIERLIEDQVGLLALPFQHMDKSGAAICDFHLKGKCDRGTSCPLRHRNGDQTVVCKHWLRGLCKKGDKCEFLHVYDMSKMPECFFYSKFNACTNKECTFLHIDPSTKKKECPWYERGFCRHGPNCRHKHTKRVLCMNYFAGFCPQGPECRHVHPKPHYINPANDQQLMSHSQQVQQSHQQHPHQTQQPMPLQPNHHNHNQHHHHNQQAHHHNQHHHQNQHHYQSLQPHHQQQYHGNQHHQYQPMLPHNNHHQPQQQIQPDMQQQPDQLYNIPVIQARSFAQPRPRRMPMNNMRGGWRGRTMM